MVLVLQFLRRLGLVLTFPPDRTITHVGTGFFCLPALARRCFLAGCLTRAMFILFLWLFLFFWVGVGGGFVLVAYRIVGWEAFLSVLVV